MPLLMARGKAPTHDSGNAVLKYLSHTNTRVFFYISVGVKDPWRLLTCGEGGVNDGCPGWC